MARGSGGAKGRGRGKAKESSAKQAKGSSANAPVGDSSPSTLAMVEARNWKDRRDVDSQTRRVIKDKLSKVDKLLVSTKTNKDGVTVYDYIKAHVVKKSAVNGRLSSGFWHEFRKQFDLTWDIAAELPELDGGEDDEEVDEELLEAISIARSRNPAERNPTTLCHFLEHCPPLSQHALHGVLTAIQPCATLCQTHARKLQLSCLKYCARIVGCSRIRSTSSLR